MAVLLLDMAYANSHKEKPNPDIIASIKKLIRWLRAMQNNDSVAAQAYKVVWKILKAVAPELQAKANDILSVNEEIVMQPQAYMHHRPSVADQHYEPRQHEDPGTFMIDNMEAFNAQPFYPEPLNDPSSSPPIPAPLHPVDESSMPVSLGHPFFTNFDQGTPFANMQDLWTDPQTFTAFDPNWPHLETPADYTGGRSSGQGGENPDADDITQQQQQQQYWTQM
jgi:hypothetical protein